MRIAYWAWLLVAVLALAWLAMARATQELSPVDCDQNSAAVERLCDIGVADSASCKQMRAHLTSSCARRGDDNLGEVPRAATMVDPAAFTPVDLLPVQVNTNGEVQRAAQTVDDFNVRLKEFTHR